MPARLVPVAEAFGRFLPDLTPSHIAARMATRSPPTDQMALVIEGDLALDQRGVVGTDELAPETTRALPKGHVPAAIFITGSIVAPDSVLAEVDHDWSPTLKVLGDVRVKSLCVLGSDSEIDGDLEVADTLLGFYNHGTLHVGGRTRARVIIASDYTFKFSGRVDCRYVLSDAGRLNIPAHFEREHLHRALIMDVLGDTNSIKLEVALKHIGEGRSLLRPEHLIGTEPAPEISRNARERLAPLLAQLAAGETVEVIDLTGADLRLVPEEVRRFAGLRRLSLANNSVRTLPDWLGELEHLRVLRLESCDLATVPASIARLPELRELDLTHNGIMRLPSEAGAFRALEILSIGTLYNSAGDSEKVDEFTAMLDLSRFLHIRIVQQRFWRRDVAYLDSDDLWNAPHLEFLRFTARFEGSVPAGLARAEGLRALECDLDRDSMSSALALLPGLRKLKLLSLYSGAELLRQDIEALHQALPGVYIRYGRLIDDEASTDDPRWMLKRKIFQLIDRRSHDEAVRAADEFLAPLDLARPVQPAEVLEGIVRGKTAAMKLRVIDTRDPGRRRDLADEAGGWADRVLAILPDHPEVLWWPILTELGRLRLECRLCQVLRAQFAGSADPDQARSELDRAQAEIDRFVRERLPNWWKGDNDRIAQVRALLPG